MVEGALILRQFNKRMSDVVTEVLPHEGGFEMTNT
jgi:hypothetical protein